MNEMDELHQEVILGHNKRPRNFRTMLDANHEATGLNPLCGDEVTVFLKENAGRIEDISFQGTSCAICKASASLMTSALLGKPTAEARGCIEDLVKLLTTETAGETDPKSWGSLAVLSGVRKFPVRVKCATLPWHTCTNALSTPAEKAQPTRPLM